MNLNRRVRRIAALSAGEPCQLVRVRTDRADWHLAKNVRATVLGTEAPNWFELDNCPNASPIKSGPGRSTWRVVTADGVMFVKVFDFCDGGLLSRVKRILAGTPAEREWLAVWRARRASVPVVGALAVGVATARQPRGVLLFPFMDPGANLADLWAQEVSHATQQLRDNRARSITALVAELFAGVHDRGFVHRDAHPRNILIRQHPAGGREAFFVDVLGASFGNRPISINRAAASLAQLNQYARYHTTPRQRLRFLCHYARARCVGSPSLRSRDFLRRLVGALDRAVTVHRRRLVRQWDRRINRSGKYFTTIRVAGGWRATVVLALARRHRFGASTVPDLTVAQWRVLLHDLLAAAPDMASEVSGLNAQDGLLTGDSATPVNWRVECAQAAGVGRRLLWALVGSPHRRAFVDSHRARHRDKPERLALAVLEQRRLGLTARTILIWANREGSSQGVETP